MGKGPTKRSKTTQHFTPPGSAAPYVERHTLVFDTETTGLTLPEVSELSKQPYIIELGAAILNSKREIISTYSRLIKPPIPISEEITKITGLKDSDLEDAPNFAEVVDEFAAFILGVPRLVAHNLPFDSRMLISELSRIGREYAFPYPPTQICTAELTAMECGKRLRLIEMYEVTLKRKLAQTHRALDDVKALCEILSVRTDI